MLVLFVTAYFTGNARIWIGKLAEQPGVRVAVIAQEDIAVLDEAQRRQVVHFAKVPDALRAADLVEGAQRIIAAEGRIDRMLSAMEQTQEPVAEARERLGIPGLSLERSRNFRDKDAMKRVLREAGVPVARVRLVHDVAGALRFAAEVGYPLVVKPPAGAASQTTYRVADDSALRTAFASASAAAGGPALLEEFVTGQEHSYDAFVKNGRVQFYSVSDYLPSCLDAMEHTWIQWCVLLRRDYESADIAEVGARALEALGLDTGMCHGEWFRRTDGSVVFSEVAARPGGAMIPTLISRAHDVDCAGAWARLMTRGEFDPFPPRAYATGAAFLRGQGSGRVRAVHGLERIGRDLGAMITDTRLPQRGQEKGASYEGEGVICVRHPETAVVEQALRHIVATVRVELG